MAIIEVERKFILSPEQCLNLLSRIKDEGEISFVDRYVDTDDCLLTGQNWWLRLRGGKWELKVGRFGPKGTTTMYEEFTDECSIAKKLCVVCNGGSFANTLFHVGYRKFAELETRRHLFSAGDFFITIDTATAESGAFHYQIAEIELQAPEEERDTALERINDLAKSLDLDDRPVRGKLVEYLRLFRPNHFAFLVARGVIAPELAV